MSKRKPNPSNETPENDDNLCQNQPQKKKNRVMIKSKNRSLLQHK